MIRVVVADDHPLVRNGIRAVLEAEADIEVVAEAEDGWVAANQARAHDADVVLLDVQMPGHDGLAGLARLQELGSRAHALMLTLYDLDDYVAEALRQGARGFLLKTGPPDELTAAVRAVHAGRMAFTQAVGERLVDAYLHRPRAAQTRLAQLRGRLSAREFDVWVALCDGLSNAEISQRLHLSEATVKTYVTRLLAKLEVRDRVQAVVLAMRNGLHHSEIIRAETQAGARAGIEKLPSSEG